MYRLIFISLLSFSAFSFDSFTYHDWCELKLNVETINDTEYQKFTLDHYKSYKMKIQECREIPYLIYKHDEQLFNFRFYREMAYGWWTPLTFIKKLKGPQTNEALDRGIWRHYEKDILHLSQSQKIQVYKNKILKDSCNRIMGTSLIHKSHCTYIDHLYLLGELSFPFFEEINLRHKRNYDEYVRNFDYRKLHLSCQMFVNTTLAYKFSENETHDYQYYSSAMNNCRDITKEIASVYPSIILKLHGAYDDDNIRTMADMTVEYFKNDMHFIKDSYHIDYEGENGIVSRSKQKTLHFIDEFYYWKDDQPMLTTENFIGIKDNFFFNQFIPAEKPLSSN